MGGDIPKCEHQQQNFNLLQVESQNLFALKWRHCVVMCMLYLFSQIIVRTWEIQGVSRKGRFPTRVGGYSHFEARHQKRHGSSTVVLMSIVLEKQALLMPKVHVPPLVRYRPNLRDSFLEMSFMFSLIINNSMNFLS